MRERSEQRNEFRELVSALHDGRLTTEQGLRLQELMRADPERLRMYARYAILESLLELGFAGTDALKPSAASAWPAKDSNGVEAARRPEQRSSASREGPGTCRKLQWAAVVALFLLAGLTAAWFWSGKQRSEDKAQAWLVQAEDCRWVDWDPAPKANTSLQGGQKLELASGQVEIRFASGARVWLRGPAIFEIIDGNTGFLTIGQATARAEGAPAAGFTIRSRTLTVTDMGTEFEFLAAADGRSQVAVKAGAVRVQYDREGRALPLLGEGSSVAVEPGAPRIIVRIEPGDGTPAFRFPTIEPPSAHDFADASSGRARIRVLRGNLCSASAKVETLLDGRGQSKADAPAESLFFQTDDSGLILIDLGRIVDVMKVNTYSWHQDRLKPSNHIRASQKYYLYGSAADQLPPVEGNLIDQGWNLIARVNTDQFFGIPITLSRPAQQAISITGAGGSFLGRYRYLLWDVRPTRGEHTNVSDNTFYGEFDVYAK
jgi:ferric-dicitrate binding protein FerR (iron transport regulator)